MKKLFFIMIAVSVIGGYAFTSVNAEIKEPVVKIEIPTSTLDTTTTYKKEPSKASQAVEATKEATDKTVKATKDIAGKTSDSAKKGFRKTKEATKDFAKKTSETTKAGYENTKEATKSFADKTVENTKEVFSNLNPNKPVTLEGLEKDAKIKILKSERNELKAAYNSRIKDTKAKVKLTQASTTMTEVEKQNKTYKLNKEIKALQQQRDNAVYQYNAKIKEIKNRKEGA